MGETFTLTVVHNNKTRDLEAELIITGYTHRIRILVNNQEVVFEPDEERNYRAVVYENADKQNPPDMELLKAIVAELEAAFK